MTGIICINKDKNISSFKACSKTRGILGEKKAGHTGTLDPMATGVLVVLLGGATRFLDFLPESDKAYKASFVLGKTTDTLDITGNIISETETDKSETEVKAVLENFRGEIFQVPPMFSAKSVNGERLYNLARQGIELEREPCKVIIKRLELVSAENGEYTIDVLCSKGTYIRSLIDDIGKKLGCGAVMTRLERTMAMGFSIEKCITLDELQQRKDKKMGFDDLILSLEEIFKDYSKVFVSSAQAKRFSNGGTLDIKRIKSAPEINAPCCVFSPDKRFLGLGINSGEELKILKLLVNK